ncbi:MAG: HAD family hydrolase [Rhodospirillales bacterium]
MRERISAVLFDMDGVLYSYDFGNRLQLLSDALGVSVSDIEDKIFKSGFEDSHDNGDIDVEGYIAGIAERLGVPVRPGQWLAARKWAMAPEPIMIDLARRLKKTVEIALLTNNGALLYENIAELAPELPPLFGDRLFVSGVHGFNKEYVSGFTGLLAHMGWRAETTLFIDDSPRYITAADQAGLVTHRFDGIDGLRARLTDLGLLPSPRGEGGA